MHEYRVSLLIRGENLDPDKITEDLNLQPSLTKRTGENRSKTAKFHGGIWKYDGSYESDGRSNWKTLEQGLKFLLNKLSPVKHKIDEYKSQFDLVFWCGHFQSSFDGGPTLSPSLLYLLGEFGVELFIDNYFSDEKIDSQVRLDNVVEL